MTFADQAQAVGSAADAQIAAITTQLAQVQAQLAASDAADASEVAQVAALTQKLSEVQGQLLAVQALLAAATIQTRFGASPGGYGAAGGAALLAQQPNIKVIRAYNPPSAGAPAWLSTAEAQFAPKAVPLIESCEPPLGSVASGASVAALKAWVSGRADIPGQVVVLWHEPENPSKPTASNPAAYVADYEAFIQNVVAPVNATRVHPIKVATTLMAYTLGPTQPHGSPEAFYVAGADYLGFDCYGSTDVARAAAYATSKAKPLIIPEYGAPLPTTFTDAEMVAQIQADLPTLNKAVAVCWFNAGSTVLSNLPLTLAEWISLEK